jgi:hypothetical protein
MRAGKLLTLVGLLGLIPLQAFAQDLDFRGDVRCLVVGIRFAALSDATYKSAGMMLSMYYFGRLDAHVPKLDIEDLIVKEVTTMTQADYGSEAQRCGGDLTAKGQEMTRIGKDLVERGNKMSPQSAEPVK